MLVWDHWHIEPSSICALQCPRCPRSEAPHSLLNRQLSLDFFKNQIGPNIIQQIKKITFCGNDGDPIYCKDFFDICRWIKQTNPNIHLTIITNGSYRTARWWTDLAKILDHHDEIHWSLDGWDQQSNQQYRINSNWDSIQQGIASFFASNITSYRIWAMIGFRFNQDNISTMQRLARDQKFDCFQLTRSTKFGHWYPEVYGTKDALQPGVDLISTSHRFEREFFYLSDKTRPDNRLKHIFFERSKMLGNYTGLCLIGNKGVFLNSRGEFYPCCWIANRYPHNDSWQGRFDLNTKTFSDILHDSFWTTEFLRFDNLECKTKCTRERLADPNHVTEW